MNYEMFKEKTYELYKMSEKLNVYINSNDFDIEIFQEGLIDIRNFANKTLRELAKAKNEETDFWKLL